MLLCFLFPLFAFSEIADPETHLFLKPSDGDSKYYRIPAIVTAADGSLVTATDKRWYSQSDLPEPIDIVVRRSTDHGKTWSPPITIAGGDTTTIGFGDPALVVHKPTGALMCLMSSEVGIWSSTPENPTRLYYSISYDNGITWSDPYDFTSQIYGVNCTNEYRRTNFQFVFITSGRAECTRSGRIMAVGVTSDSAYRTSYENYLIYTDDLGKSWHCSSEPAYDYGDEAKVVQLNNGSILMSIRTRNGHRYFAISNDEGDTWPVKGYERSEIVDPNCNAEIMRYTSTLDGYDQDRLIHTYLDSTSGRRNLTLLVSYDEGETWVHNKRLYTGLASYSTMTMDPYDGSIFVYWENEYSDGSIWMKMTKITLDWLTDGEDTYTQPSESKKLKNHS